MLGFIRGLKSVRGLCLMGCGLAFHGEIMAELIFTTPPGESVSAGEDIYTPITKKLTELLGEQVVYEPPSSWKDYTDKMRDGHYDIVFDEPHFTAWRMKNLDHMPVVSLPGRLGYYLVVNQSDKEIESPRDLVGKQICGMSSPHLATDMIYDLYNNPVLQPQILTVKGGMNHVYHAFKQGKCRGIIFRDLSFHRLPQNEKIKLKVIARTRTLPNQTLTVSSGLKENAGKLAEFFTSKDGAIVSDGILTRYSKRKKFFQSATMSEYQGAELVLESAAFGW